MPFTKKPHAFKAAINEVTIGTGDKAVTIGGENTYPFYTFDNPVKNKPVIGAEVSDAGYENEPESYKAFFGTDDLVERAKKAAAMDEVAFICLHFAAADPFGANKSVEECVEQAKAVAGAVDKPLVIMGCKNIDKDTELFSKVSEALAGKNIVVLSAREENYKTVGASAGLAYSQKVSAESAVDINLAKQLNVLMMQLGVNPKSMLMNLGSASAGYGYEYVASTMDRVRSAALGQNDTQLQMPVITPVSTETWAVKESIAEEADMPEWGAREERGIDMEVVTAAASLSAGSDAVILKHPESIRTIYKLIDALC
jgi:acetyl-CoA decarbonylase/synthase complex subunit delta